jgi:anti-anti-sigma factor
MSFKIKIRKVNSTPVLEIFGEITGENVAKVMNKLDSLRNNGSKMIAVDLGKTTFIDSHGLGAFVYSWRLLEENKRQLVFINPHGFVYTMFSGTNLDKIFKVVEENQLL